MDFMDILILFGFPIMIVVFFVLGFIFSFYDTFIKPNTKKQKALVAHRKKLIQEHDKMAIEKGAYFEDKIRDLILYYLPGSKVKQNIIIRNGNFSKEIDLVALTPKGFFLVEAKNYNGCTIKGNPKEKKWRCSYDEKNCYDMYNPIFQATSGIWNIKKHIHNIFLDKFVVFSDNCSLSKEILRDENVYTFSSFREALEKLQFDKEDIFNETAIEQLNEALDKLDTVSREEHIKNVEQIQKRK